jgi:hypothetical protein
MMHRSPSRFGFVNETAKVPDEGSAKEVTSHLTNASVIRTHLTLAGGLALCAAAFWFELGRAEGGNELSWAYVFEWPLLAIFAIYMWWKLLHPGFTFRRPREKVAVAPEFEGMLQAWQGEVRKLEVDRRADEIGSAQPSDDATRLDDE